MKLSQREKLLLAVLGVLAISWLFASFIIKPQYETLQESRSKLGELQKKVADIELYNDPNGAIQKKYKESEDAIAAATTKYFPEILQERQIRIVDQMLTTSALNGNVLSFSKITPGAVLEREEEKETSLQKNKKPKAFLLRDLTQKIYPESKAEENQDQFTGNGVVEVLETEVEFTGAYPQLINFIKALETYPQKILISNINITTGKGTASAEVPTGPGGLSGTINIQFYGIPKMHPDQDQDYTTWDIYDVYGRANPYLP